MTRRAAARVWLALVLFVLSGLLAWWVIVWAAIQVARWVA